MTVQIAIVLGILLAALVLFVTEWIRMDLVALLVLGALALTGSVTAEQALAGFSNPAVVTVWAMFILSEGLTRTGVATLIGRPVMGLAGAGEARLVIVIMLVAGGLSALMNNIGVAALMLPVVMDICRKTGLPPSRVLMPLAFATLLGGLTTLVGTPPNLLISGAMQDAGLQPFGLFDFSPVGLSVMVGGTAFVALLGRRLLPVKDIARSAAAGDERVLSEQYALHERAFIVSLPEGCLLAGKTLAQSRLGSAVGLNVIGLIHDGRLQPAPGADAALRVGDRLLVEGRPDRFNAVRGWRELHIDEVVLGAEHLVSDEIALVEARIAVDSHLAGSTVAQAAFRQCFGVNVLAVKRGDAVSRTELPRFVLAEGDELLLQGHRDHLAVIDQLAELVDVRPVSLDSLAERYHLHERLFLVRVAPTSVLVGDTLAESRLGEAFGLRVLGIRRERQLHLLPAPDERLAAGDRLLLEGKRGSLEVLRGIQQLEIERATPADLGALDSPGVSMVEVVLAPRSSLAGRSLRELRFREKYGLQVLAIWRDGEARRSDLRDRALGFGDALLLLGQREKLALLGREPDFLVLTRDAQEPPNLRRAPLSSLVVLGVIVPVLIGWIPIHIAAVVGATAMVLFGCLRMDEAYRAIEWRSIFLIAGMLPLGAAMQQSGAASLLAEGMLELLGPLGPWPMIAGFYLVTALATTVVPTAALVVLMAPIVMQGCAELGVAPQAAMMAVAVAASASFTSPIAHPANVMVMGPGGYRFVDYLKLGVPLALVVAAITFATLPVFWPLRPS